MRKGTNKIRRHGLMLFTSKRDHAVTSCIWFSQHVNMCCSHRRRLRRLFGRTFAWRTHYEAKTKEWEEIVRLQTWARQRDRMTKCCSHCRLCWRNFFSNCATSKGGVRVFCYFATRQSADYNANVYGFFFVVAARSLGSSLPKRMPLSDLRLSGQTCYFALTYVQ